MNKLCDVQLTQLVRRRLGKMVEIHEQSVLTDGLSTALPGDELELGNTSVGL